MIRLISILTISFIATAFAEGPVSKSFLGGIAIGGVDTVAYHEEATQSAGKEVTGSKKFTVEWNDAKWRFSNAEDRDRFAANPEQYIPTYNGHCANALSLGKGLVKTDGTVWKFFDNELYLFYQEAGLQRWLDGDFRAFRSASDQAWHNITQAPK